MKHFRHFCHFAGWGAMDRLLVAESQFDGAALDMLHCALVQQWLVLTDYGGNCSEMINMQYWWYSCTGHICSITLLLEPVANSTRHQSRSSGNYQFQRFPFALNGSRQTAEEHEVQSQTMFELAASKGCFVKASDQALHELHELQRYPQR
jgi:hypothetical protein